jgi:hypothetical protein
VTLSWKTQLNPLKKCPNKEAVILKNMMYLFSVFLFDYSLTDKALEAAENQTRGRYLVREKRDILPFITIFLVFIL